MKFSVLRIHGLERVHVIYMHDPRSILKHIPHSHDIDEPVDKHGCRPHGGKDIKFVAG